MPTSKGSRKRAALAMPDPLGGESVATSKAVDKESHHHSLHRVGDTITSGASAAGESKNVDEVTDRAAPVSTEKKTAYKTNKGAPRRRAWSLAEKKQLCRKYRDSTINTMAQFLREYNETRADEEKISLSSAQHWWKDVQRGRIRLDDLSTGADDKVKRRRGGKFVTVEMRLAEYIQEYEKIRGEGDPALTGPAMLRKAKEFAEELGDTSFQGSKGWLWNFRRRNGLQKYLIQVDSQKQEDLEEVVTTGQVRDALSTLSTFAAQSGNQGLAVDVARLHQKLAMIQHVTRNAVKL
uniref:HTH CENPB-type domain-containing protein n=1 Tax=Odontella aurita TaxID=265563 RepID=A0A7S4N5G0_9STRA|mmetsp:Transcript_48149/g.145439  ORF Transcript_48149/g.145439 Transcript_48149/m.145439 type:complete len:294 (+) Transcript_48149:227-1108(+)